MNRAQRRWHRRAFFFLAPALALVLGWAILSRTEPVPAVSSEQNP